MLHFTPIEPDCAPLLYSYYRNCAYRLCEYSVGVKLMWRRHWRPEYAQSHGCLVVLNHSPHYGDLFDLPVPLPGEGDVDAALEDIEAWCVDHERLPAYGCVPESERDRLFHRYPYLTVDAGRVWQDYLYRVEDLSTFAGRRYSGQRNHIHRFEKLYPEASFRPLTEEDGPALKEFWRAYRQGVNRDNCEVMRETCYAQRYMDQVGKPWVKAGCLELDGKLLAISVGEVCGDTLVCHIEKGLSEYQGVYPAMVRSFAAAYGEGLAWINREDDAGEPGLRTSKLQYLPAFLGSKTRFFVRSELSSLHKIPALSTERLTLDALREEDKPLYNRLCLDDERNRWWGYDYREDVEGMPDEDYFLRTAREDFRKKTAVNFAVRLEGRFVGEVVLYRFDGRGSAELGCRILSEYAGHGYGGEAFQRAAEWSLYTLGLYRLKAKCRRENEPSRRMLERCMRKSGEDETYLYYEKLV